MEAIRVNRIVQCPKRKGLSIPVRECWKCDCGKIVKADYVLCDYTEPNI